MSAYLASRGCIYNVTPSGAGGVGFYVLSGLKTKGTSTLILGATVDDEVLSQPLITLDNRKFIYTFGDQFASVRIFGEILLGPAGGGKGNPATTGYGDLKKFYDSKKISKSPTPVMLTCPNGVGYAVYLIGLSFGQADPTTHVQPFTLNGITAESVG